MTIPATTMLYRASDTPNHDVWGLKVEHRPFADEDVKAALDDGWALHPHDVKAKEKPEGGAKSAAPKPEAKTGEP